MKRVAAAALAAAAMLAIACSTRVNDPDTAIKKMLGAYGGAGKVKLLTSYTGKGFMRDLARKQVVRNHPFDICQRGALIKNRLMKVTKGKLTEVMVTYFDGTEAYQWKYGGTIKTVNRWEFDLLKYKFPLILTWIQESDITGEIVTGENDSAVCLLRFENGNDIVTLTLDSKSFLLEKVEILSAADTAFVYSEEYGDYRKVDGIYFPNRFRGWYKGSKYYEYMIPVIEYGVELPDSIFSLLSSDSAGVWKEKAQTETD